jgi:hypothetical protein
MSFYFSSEKLYLDLKWLIESNSLISKNYAKKREVSLFEVQYDFEKNKNKILTELPEFVELHLKSTRLGLYFETLFQYFLEKIINVSELEHNKFISKANSKNQAGALDFFFKEHSKFVHLEMAVKFYLFNYTEKNLSMAFVGPEGIDRFDIKTDKIFNEQLELSKKISFDSDISRQILFKGIIFYNFFENELSLNSEIDFLASSHQKEVWIKEQDLKKYLSLVDSKTCFKLLKKIDWINTTSDKNLQTLSIDDLYKHCFDYFQANKRSLLFDQIGNKKIKLMITSNYWPNLV